MVCQTVYPFVCPSPPTQMAREFCIYIHIYTYIRYVILGLTQAPSLTPICAPSPFTPHALLLRQQQTAKKVSLIYSWKNLQRLARNRNRKEQLELKSNWTLNRNRNRNKKRPRQKTYKSFVQFVNASKI